MATASPSQETRQKAAQTVASSVGPAAVALPAWLTQPEDYQAGTDRDGFITKSILSVTGVLARLRMDDGKSSRYSPSAPCKLICGLVCILLTSLARNYAFVLIVLALVLLRATLLPAKVLSRTAAVAGGAAALSALLMLPALLLGQSQSALLVGTKVLVTVSIAMIVAGTTPAHELTRGLRSLHVPGIVVMTVDLALKNIVRLGRLALRTLTALKLRSVGVNRDKGASVGGVGGVLFLKSEEAARTTYDAMTCRGFTGDYRGASAAHASTLDCAWVLAMVALAALFAYLQVSV